MRALLGRAVPAALLLASAAACGAYRHTVGPAGVAAGGGRSGPADLDSIVPPTTRSWPAMRTTLEISVWQGDTALAARALEAGRAAVGRVDSLVTAGRPESEIARVNRRAGTDSATVVSPETAEVLAAALRYAEATGGAVDPTAAPLADLWSGYDRRGERPPRAALDSARALVDWRRVRFDLATRSVRLPLPGMRLDVDALARGYALDRAAAAMRGAGLDRGMIDVGENVLVFGPPPPGTGAWGVGILDPRNPDAVLGVVTLDSGAVTTTADDRQGLAGGGERHSRTVDPRTGAPPTGSASATAVAPTGLAAAALATAFFVLGADRGCVQARAWPGSDGLWIRDGGAVSAGAPPPIPVGGVVATPALLDRLQLSAEPGRRPAPRACGS
ncbi:MAG TPA: FAD:protein FMN transferase [Longimicrobiales bacterium]|nr:FAD:protein FMN transferase [Longimicrobiales bacterium]